MTDEDRAVPNRKTTSGAKRGGARRAAPKGARKQAARRSRGLFGLVRSGIYWSLVLAIWCGIGFAGLVVYYGAKMPNVADWAVPDRAPNVKILAVDGSLIANRGLSGGEAIGLHEMSPFIPQAVVAIEDRRFYSHFGVDPLGLGRAIVQNVIEGRVSQGGSTLTQQLAKNLFLKPDRTIERKVQEVLMALWLEQKHSKDQILEMYLNRVYFGSGSYGVEAASQRYFGKSARDVTLPEAALLAGLLKAPSRLSPARDPKAAEARAALVLQAMRDQGQIGDGEMKVAMSAPASRAASYWTGSENYVADRVMEELPGLVGDVTGDLVVETTVDLTLQKFAEASIRNLIRENGEKLAVSQGALVSIDSVGAVRAMVGGYDYANSQFDRASEARRQPGSAFKPFVYMAALEAGRRPDSMRNDAPIRIGKWTPENYNGKYYGQVTLATALAKSLNSVAAQLTMEVGPKAVVEAAHRLGIESKLEANTSIALGTSEVTPLELTAAYVPFANGGYKPDVHFVQRITSAGGKVVYEHRKTDFPRVVKPEIVAMMNAMMAQTITGGTATKARFGWPAAGKTGTSQNSRDAWFVGYTANLTTGVWFGNDDGKPMKKITGGSLPAQAWHAFMVQAHEGVKVRPLPSGTWGAGDAHVDDAIPDETDRPASDDVPMAGGRSASGDDAVALPASADGPAYEARPVPKVDVGQTGSTGRKPASIMDVILGN